MLPRSWPPLIAILALAAAVRCQHLGALSYNFDEAFCVKMAAFPAREIWRRAALDNHPPLYFCLLSWWTVVFADSPAATRSMSVALGLASVVAAYGLVRRIMARGTPQRGRVRNAPAQMSAALTPALSRREREKAALTPALSQREREKEALTPAQGAHLWARRERE